MAGNGATDDLEYDLTKQSVGYLSKEDYKRKREHLEHEKALNALKRMAGAPAPALPTMADTNADASGGGGGNGGGAADASGSAPPSEAKKKKAKKEKKKGGGAALSFGDELEEEAEAVSPGGPQIGGLSAARAREAAQAAERQEAAMRKQMEAEAHAAQMKEHSKSLKKMTTEATAATVNKLSAEEEAMRAEAARLKQEENDRRAAKLASENAELKEKLANSGPAIEAALSDDVNAMRDAKKMQSDAEFAAAEEARKDKEREIAAIKSQTGSRTDHALS